MSNDVQLVLIGGLISIFSSFASVWFSKILNNPGSIKVFCKFTGSKKDQNTFGVYKSKSGDSFMRLPMWIDIFNTYGHASFVRDFNILAYDGNHLVKEFVQIQAIGDITNSEMGNNQMYSFVVDGHGVKRFNTEFILSHNGPLTDKRITTLKARYYDERGRKHIKAIYNFSCNDIWDVQRFEYKNEWIEI